MNYKELLEDIKRTRPELNNNAKEVQMRIMRTRQQQSRLCWMGNIQRIRDMKTVAFKLLDRVFIQFKDKQQIL